MKMRGRAGAACPQVCTWGCHGCAGGPGWPQPGCSPVQWGQGGRFSTVPLSAGPCWALGAQALMGPETNLPSRAVCLAPCKLSCLIPSNRDPHMELREEAWSPGPLDSEDQQMASHENPGEVASGSCQLTSRLPPGPLASLLSLGSPLLPPGARAPLTRPRPGLLSGWVASPFPASCRPWGPWGHLTAPR